MIYKYFGDRSESVLHVGDLWEAAKSLNRVYRLAGSTKQDGGGSEKNGAIHSAELWRTVLQKIVKAD